MDYALQRRPAQAYYRSSAEPELVLNFLPLTLSCESFAGGLIPFESSEELAALRSRYATSHVFHRQGDSVACIPLSPDSPAIGTPTTFNVGRSAGLVRRLVQDAIIRFLVASDYRLTSFDPPSFVVRQPQWDLLARAAGRDARKLAWLHVYPMYKLHPVVIYGADGPMQGILIDVKTRREIDCTVAELLQRGVSMIGRYVLSKEGEQARDVRRDPSTRFHVEGRVDAVVGDYLILGDASRLQELRTDQAWLEARPDNFADAIKGSGVANPQAILRQLDQAVFGMVGAKGRYQRAGATAERLREPILLAHGLSCTVTGPSVVKQGNAAGTYRRFGAPTFVFDPAGSKTDRTHDRGLEAFGPFDAEVFTPKRPHIAVVTPKSFQGDVEVFLRQFKEGVPNAKTFAQGFVRKYRLSDCTFSIEAFEPGAREAISYRQACLNALSATPKPHLAFVIIKEEHQQLLGDDDPYLVAKSVCMSQGIPVQEVTIETIRVPPDRARSIPYTLSGIALASYAKLGGIPFVINTAHSLAEELVIGIGSATLSEGRLAGNERLVGITTVFTADGNYLLHNTSREVPYEEYPDELLTTLRTAVNLVQKRNAWQTGDAIRLVFHVFKPLKDIEAQAVKQLVAGLVRDYRVEFAFLHVSEQHDWMLFDRKSEGTKDWQVDDPQLRGKLKGEYVPERGYAVPLGRSEILLSVIGPKGLVTPLQGTPRPLLLKLHRESTFVDLEYLAGQAYRFTSLSWRSLFPSNKPVTILYSDLIASLLGRLRKVRNWNPDVLDTMLRTSRWFL